MGGVLLAAFSASAQQRVSIRASVDKNKVLLGEPFRLTIETSYPAGATPVLIGIDSLPHFERLGSPVIDTQRTAELTRIRSVYTYASFDSGHWVIPRFSLAEGIRSDTLPMDVVFSDFDSTQPYHDIKDVADVPPAEKSRSRLWYILIGAALLFGLLYLYFRLKKKPVAAAPVSEPIRPYEEAIRQLDALRRSRPETKEFHTRLIDILRWYVYRKRGVLSLQKTSDDLLRQLTSLGLKELPVEGLSAALHTGDMVKFARYSAGPEEDAACFEAVKSFIVHLEEAERPQPQA